MVTLMSLPSLDNISPIDPRFIELQEELRDVVLNGLSTLSPSGYASGQRTDDTERLPAATLPNLGLSAVSIPHTRLVRYLDNWAVNCAPIIDKFDKHRHFQIHVPRLSSCSPALLYAVLAFSARQMERKGLLDQNCDSLELYQESIRLLAPDLQAKDPNMLVTSCILAVFELMSGSSRDWRRHLEGCAALFEFFNVNGSSGGLLQAVFWCYARMDLCGAIISEGAELTMMQPEKWLQVSETTPELPGSPEETTRTQLLLQQARTCSDMYANWSVSLCAQVCNLRCRRLRYLELGEADKHDKRPFEEQWWCLWNDLQCWVKGRQKVLLPIIDAESSDESPLPIIFFPHFPAISSNQLYHTSCILMLDISPSGNALPSPECSAIWHARRVCGISCSNPHRGSLINSIQPLYVAGRLLTHPSEHIEVARILKKIDTTTGWGALWRLRDLESEWGYNQDEILDML